jgi:hypothetical protein
MQIFGVEAPPASPVCSRQDELDRLSAPVDGVDNECHEVFPRFEEVRFASDSLVEGRRFELSGPVS